jgi:hypothetical protein
MRLGGWKLGLVASLGSTAHVAAQPAAHLSLTWDAPLDCPNREDVQARVDALLGGEAGGSTVADVQASGQVERAASGFRLQLGLATGGRPTVRKLEAKTCEELAGAAAIAIALLARSGTTDSGASESASSETSPPGEAAPSAARPGARPEARAKAVSPRRQERSEDAPTKKARAHLLVDAPLAVVGWGSLPSVGLGVGAAAGLRWRALGIVAGGELWRPQTLERSGFSMRFTLQSARADACVTQELGGVEVGPCAGVALERLSGRGVPSAVFTARSSSAVWASGTGGVLAAVPVPGLSALRILAQASVRVATQRPRFVIDQLGPVHQPAVAAPKLDFGCRWIF